MKRNIVYLTLIFFIMTFYSVADDGVIDRDDAYPLDSQRWIRTLQNSFEY